MLKAEGRGRVHIVMCKGEVYCAQAEDTNLRCSLRLPENRTFSS